MKGKQGEGETRKQGGKDFSPLLPFTFQILRIVCNQVLADLEGEISLSPCLASFHFPHNGVYV
jgi:hypothetical protein